ncbi:MAG: hypothetical protein DWQ34_03565 [Planctomycetota bacterium]|nr:MAG: hypothetical protein DWQ29_11050 [Planctomycetota bacterium]REJ96615.1 MAG: hypothetical protein DWQ34_03565 [Planctomycetota bacterium]REK24725.1 MAG: hypothetical protein DWQ41_13395 [Planctomycetota bacterium]REK29996.1 MAG: hypothetical protein DWQ45_22080 [Planctomycetota bacterium]
MSETKPETSSPNGRAASDSLEEKNVLARVVTIFLGLGAVGILGACLAAAYFFSPRVSEDPAAVPEVMDGMLEVDIPAAFEPRGTIEWNMAFAATMQGAYFEPVGADGDGVLLFVQVDSGSGERPAVRQHIEEVLRADGSATAELVLEAESREERAVLIRGEPVPFVFETATDPKTRRTYRLMHGVVEGRNGLVLISLRMRDDANWDEEKAVAMLQSIR